jgi:hypothetical protein
VSEETEGSAPQAVNKWLGIIGSFVGPTTVISALCYYFGYISTREYFAYFGIDSDALGFSTTDYVMKSASVLYAPIIAGLLTWTVVLWAGVYVRWVARAGRHTRLIRGVGWAAITIGGLGIAGGVIGVALPGLVFGNHVAPTPVALGLGTVLLAAGFWILTTSTTRSAPRPFAAAERGSLVVAAAVIVLALFWLINIFATAYGENRAEATAGKLWSQESSVVLDTSERLGAPANLIAESTLPSADPAAAKFRYQCFRSLVVQADRWVLVPARWTPEDGYAVIVTLDSSNRISLNRLKGIAKTGSVNWAAPWQCPEVAPPTA